MKKRAKKKPANIAKKKADMSVSELAGMVARGFTEIHDEIGSARDEMHDMEERLTAKIGNVEQKVDIVRDSVNELSYETRKTRSRIENLELKVFGTIQES